MAKKIDSVTLRNVQVRFTNFRGEKGQYNELGNRFFNLYFLPEDSRATKLKDDGWNLKELKNEDGMVSAYLLQVKLNYSSYNPPRVYKVSDARNTSTLLEEHTVGLLDGENIEYVDVTFNPHLWSMPGGRSGVSAYCQVLYAHVHEDELEIEWLLKHRSGGCVFNGDLVQGKVYICNLETGLFEEVDLTVN